MLEEERPELYRQAIAHLTAGRNVVFYGPPGTGKTRAAKLVAGWLCSDFDIETANAEWSNYTVVGGWQPDDSGSGGFEPGRGFLTEAAETCRIEIDNGNQPHWLVVDELNRANLDEAFGDIFTDLDIDYRSEYPVSYAGEDQQIPLSFRILATMNSYDRAQLFSLGYAFRRRFAFVAVDSLFRGSDSISYSGWGSTSEGSEPGTKPENMEEIIEIAREETVSHFQRTGKNNDGSIKLPDKDAAAIEIDLASENIRDTIDTVLGDDSLRTSGLNPLEAVMHLIGETHEAGVVDVGQAAVIDILKYLTAYRLLFADSMGPHVVDQAAVSYLVPQYDAVMPDLRRAKTIGQESGAVQDYRRIVNTADELGLRMTEKKLNNPIENDEYSLI
jgi:hypothetical protein